MTVRLRTRRSTCNVSIVITVVTCPLVLGSVHRISPVIVIVTFVLGKSGLTTSGDNNARHNYYIQKDGRHIRHGVEATLPHLPGTANTGTGPYLRYGDNPSINGKSWCLVVGRSRGWSRKSPSFSLIRPHPSPNL